MTREEQMIRAEAILKEYWRKKTAPPTNYDLLVSKTPEELADWIELLLCPSNCPDEQMGEACARTTCDGCWLSWLKSPVEVDK